MDQGIADDSNHGSGSNGLSSNNGGIFMLPLELEEDDEEERDSLLNETAEYNPETAAMSRGNLLNRRHRIDPSKASSSTSMRSRLTAILGISRESVGHHFSYRNFALLATMAVCVVLLVRVFDYDMEHENMEEMVVRPHHAPSHGGECNAGFFEIHEHCYDAKKLPKSNIGHAVASLSDENINNLNGHYMHDHEKDPYASPLYPGMNDKLASERNASFYTRMQKVNETFGQWSPPDPGDLRMPEFDSYPYWDMPYQAFPPYAWQLDPDYTQTFLDEALALVKRVKDGIHLEYGLDPKKQPEDFDVILDNFEQRKGVAYDPVSGEPLQGAAFLNPGAWEGLVRKLLHGMMTGDYLYAVVVGSSQTYEAMNFMRTQIMQFNYIMEPVLDKVGITLISRNMGMNASTTVSALGGADVYGEADIFWYLPDSRPGAKPETEMQIDLLQKQAILSGERMPIILTPFEGSLLEHSNNKAWLGNIQPGSTMCGETYETTQAFSGKLLHKPVEDACQYVNCRDPKASYCRDYKSVCWIDRKDVSLSVSQDKRVPYIDKNNPNYNQHRLAGRKLAMLVLHALEEALQRWSKELENGNDHLPDEMWQVQEVYEDLRDSVRSLVRTAGKPADVPPCEILLDGLDPMICHLSMHVYTEWTPQVNADQNRIKHIVKGGFAQVDPDAKELYTKVDLLPHEWEIQGDDNVDVHMIAIVSSYLHESEEQLYGPFEYLAGDDDSVDVMDDDVASDDTVGAAADNNENEPPRGRQLQATSGTMWTLMDAPIGFCDGSAQSRCNRSDKNHCMLANHNFYRGGFAGHGNSGWLNMSLPYVREGIIMARFDWDVLGGRRRRLDELPRDFKFDYVINGKLTSLTRKDYLNFEVKLADDLWIAPLMIDRNMSLSEVDPTVFHLSLRVESEQSASDPIMFLTHIYYA